MQYSDVSLQMNWTPAAQLTEKKVQLWEKLLIYLVCCAPWYHIMGKSSARPCNPKSSFSIERAETLRSSALKLRPCSPSSTSWFVRWRFCHCLFTQLPGCWSSKTPFCLLKMMGLHWAISIPVS